MWESGCGFRKSDCVNYKGSDVAWIGNVDGVVGKWSRKSPTPELPFICKHGLIKYKKIGFYSNCSNLGETTQGCEKKVEEKEEYT